MLCALLCLVLAGCSGEHRITVGSKNFTEQLILGEIIAQHIENRLHTRVRRKLDLGGTFLTQQAIVTGSIDLYPEYTGTALTSVLKQPVLKDPVVALERVRAGYAHWNLRWMNPLGFENTFAMAIRRSDAESHHIKSLTDAAASGTRWRMGVGYEFEQRPDGLPGLQNTYHLQLNGAVRTMDLGLLYRALAQNQVDMVAGNSTDGALSVLPVNILVDDMHFFPPYDAAIVVRNAALQEFPGLENTLKDLEGRLDTKLMQQLNYQVDAKHRPVPQIAAEVLRSIEAGGGGHSPAYIER